MENKNGKPGEVKLSAPSYAPDQLAAYYEDLKNLLEAVEDATTHYSALGIDELATTGEVKLAYTRAAALLHPSFYDLNLPQPPALLSRIDAAFEKISAAYSVLVNFKRRVEYDDLLFQRLEEEDLAAAAAAAEKAEKAAAPAAEGEPPRPPERRREQRFQLALPVRIAGFAADGSRWQEMTQTTDVSLSGALAQLRAAVEVGQILNVSLPMPATLRSHAFFDADYNVFAIVRRQHPQGAESRLIGVEFFGDDLPPGYFDKPWGTFTEEIRSSMERRAAARIRSARQVTVEYFDKGLTVICREEALTEDISQTGIRVCANAIPATFSLVRITGEQGKLKSFATLIGRYVGDDGVERLCLKFLDP